MKCVIIRDTRVLKLKVVGSVPLYHLLNLSISWLDRLSRKHLFCLADEIGHVRAQVQGHIQMLFLVLNTCLGQRLIMECCRLI